MKQSLVRLYGFLKMPILLFFVEAQMYMLSELHIIHEQTETVIGLCRACDMIGECGIVSRI